MATAESVMTGIISMFISNTIGSCASSGSILRYMSILFFRSECASSMFVPYSSSNKTAEAFSIDIDSIFLMPLKVAEASSI